MFGYQDIKNRGDLDKLNLLNQRIRVLGFRQKSTSDQISVLTKIKTMRVKKLALDLDGVEVVADEVWQYLNQNFNVVRLEFLVKNRLSLEQIVTDKIRVGKRHLWAVQIFLSDEFNLNTIINTMITRRVFDKVLINNFDPSKHSADDLYQVFDAGIMNQVWVEVQSEKKLNLSEKYKLHDQCCLRNLYKEVCDKIK